MFACSPYYLNWHTLDVGIVVTDWDCDIYIQEGEYVFASVWWFVCLLPSLLKQLWMDFYSGMQFSVKCNALFENTTCLCILATTIWRLVLYCAALTGRASKLTSTGKCFLTSSGFITVRLHVMQRRILLSEFCPSVCLSVRSSDARIVTKINDGLRIF